MALTRFFRGVRSPQPAAAPPALTPEVRERAITIETARKEVDTPFPFLRYNVDPRLAKFAVPLEKIYSVYLTALKAERQIPINKQVMKVNFTMFLHDLRGKITSMPIDDIISASSEESILTLSTEEKAALNAIFRKVYSIHSQDSSWPPNDYNNSILPSLSTIIGYTDENILQYRIRLLAAIKNGLNKNNITLLDATSPPETLEATFDAIKRIGYDAAIPYLNMYCKPEWDKHDTLMTNSNIIYFNEDPAPDRYYPHFSSNTFRSYIYQGLALSQWADMNGVTFYHYIPEYISKQLRSNQSDRNQQIFIIKQGSSEVDDGTVANISRTDEVREPSDGLPISDYQFIHVNFSGFTITNPLKTFKRAIIYQGYRLTHFPHPEVLLSFTKQILKLTPHMRELFPEFITKTSRHAWIQSALETWNRDIEAMTDPNQKYMQRYLYNDILPKIEAALRIEDEPPLKLTAKSVRDISILKSLFPEVMPTYTLFPTIVSQLSAWKSQIDSIADPTEKQTELDIYSKIQDIFIYPQILLIIARGQDITKDMIYEYPQLRIKENRLAWLNSELEKWKYDIECSLIPLYVDIQTVLYNDTKQKIPIEFAAPTRALPRIDANIKRLAANANTTDPNAMFGRVQNFQQSYASVLAPLKTAGRITELQERNKGRRWYGAAIESKEAYRAKIKSYIAQIQRALGGPSAVSTEVDMILKLARVPKPNTRDLYARFYAWRRTLDYSKFPIDLANRIREVRPAGFFTGAAGYAAKIAELVLATQQTGPQAVAGAVLDTTLSTISSGVRALEQDLDTLPRDEQTTEMVRVIHEIPSYTKGSMDPRAYLVRVFEGLKQAYTMFGVWRSSRPPHGAGAGAGAAAHVGGRRRTVKTSAKSKGMIKRRHNTQRQQRGGASMPLAYYQDGAQMRGTYTDTTGVGLAGSTATMARTGISQTGGRRSGCRQNGGFAPSIMGQMVVNGAFLTPVASYMGYRLMKNSRSHHSGSRTSRASRGSRSTHKKRRVSHRR